MYVDDCVEGLIRLMASNHPDALNLGTDQMVTINELFAMISKIADKKLRARHDLTKPQGVRGRNSDNTRLREVLGWEPGMPLEDGLRITYRWIEEEMQRAGRTPVLVRRDHATD
jgi:nucleoside-diphosphate-sugar epimerase